MTGNARTNRVAVVGGGYAGMAAAVSLAERGYSVTVFEAGRTLGGRARKIEYRDEVLDNGQHILSGAYKELLRLMNLVGVDSNACARIPLTLHMPPDFSLQAPNWIAPFHLVWALIGARGLTWSERLAAVRFIGALRLRHFQVGSDVTVSELLSDYAQPAALVKFLWQPLTISALNTPVSTASGQVFANVIRDALASTREASDMLLPQKDLSSLFPEPAADWLARHNGNVKTGARVKAIAPNDNQLRLETDIGVESFESVVVAVGPHQLENISFPSQVHTPVGFEYEPIATIYIKFDGPVRLAVPMFGQAEGIVQWFFDRRQLLGIGTSAEQGLIAAVISASGPHQTLPHDELAAAVVRELQAHTGPLPSTLWSKVVIEKYATFACTAKIQSKRPDISTNLPGLFICGDYSAGDYPGTLEGAVRNGIRAAETATTFMNRKPH